MIDRFPSVSDNFGYYCKGLEIPVGTQVQCVRTFNAQRLENLHFSPVNCELLVPFAKWDNVVG